MMQGKRRPGPQVNGNVANYKSQDNRPKKRGPIVFSEPQKLHKMLADMGLEEVFRQSLFGDTQLPDDLNGPMPAR